MIIIFAVSNIKDGQLKTKKSLLFTITEDFLPLFLFSILRDDYIGSSSV